MIQKLLTKYWLAFHLVILFLAVGLSVLFPGTGMTVSLFWLSFFVIQAFLLLPSMLPGETMSAARSRASVNIIHDPFLCTGVALIIFAILQWLNSGCALTYLDDAEVWRYSPPPVGWLPFSVESYPAFVVMTVFAVCVIGGGILRNGTGKLSKRFFLDMASLFSGCIAIYMAAMCLAGHKPYSTWAASPEACNWGMYFGFWLIVAIGGHLNFIEEGFTKTFVWSFSAILGNLLGVLLFAQPLGVALFVVAALLMLGYWMFFLARQTAGLFAQLKLTVCMLAALGLVLILLVLLIPENPAKAKFAQLVDEQYYETLLSGRHFQAPLAWKIWQDHPWTGAGAQGFTHYSRMLVEEADWTKLDAHGGLLSNDWLQFLTEEGIIGTGLLLGLLVILLIPLFYRLRFFVKQLMSKTGDGMEFLDIDPYVISGIVATALVLGLSFVFSPLQSGAILVSFMYVLAVIPGLLPAGTERGEARG